MFEQFGAKPTKEDLRRYAQSPNWRNRIFRNEQPVELKIGLKAIPRLIYRQFILSKRLRPKQEIPILHFDFQKKADDGRMRAAWFGHSVLFMQLQGLNILIDPMFGENSAPISPFPVRRFSKNTLSIIDQLPLMDLILISHDHYDHLDYHSIKKLKSKGGKYLVALGVKRHLVKWGIKEDDIIEFDWWDEYKQGQVEITFTPTQHFSGRGMGDRFKSLWGGWAFRTSSQNIYFSGDSGYGPHFKEIGKRLGPFDFGFMECGQYNELWKAIHMFPEESVQAAIDAAVEKAMPVHWAAFALAQHQWREPVIRFVKEAKKRGVNYLVPEPGSEFSVDFPMGNAWWQSQQ